MGNRDQILQAMCPVGAQNIASNVWILLLQMSEPRNSDFSTYLHMISIRYRQPEIGVANYNISPKILTLWSTNGEKRKMDWSSTCATGDHQVGVVVRTNVDGDCWSRRDVCRASKLPHLYPLHSFLLPLTPSFTLPSHPHHSFRHSSFPPYPFPTHPFLPPTAFALTLAPCHPSFPKCVRLIRMSCMQWLSAAAITRLLHVTI